MVERVDANLGPFSAVGDARSRMQNVIGHEARIVDLHQKSGIDDRLVFFAHRVRDRENVFFLRLVIGVLLPVLDIRRRNSRHENVSDPNALKGGFEIVDIALELGVTFV